MLRPQPLQAAARPEASPLGSRQAFSGTAASSRPPKVFKHAVHAAPAIVDGSVGELSEQLPGIAMPVMTQLQQNQQQLQEQLEHARWQLQQQQEQQHRQTAVLLPKPGINSTNSVQQRGLSPDMPLNPRAVQQLRERIAAATTMQHLLQVMPSAAADKNADSVARVLLQAVKIRRRRDSSSSHTNPAQLPQTEPTRAVPTTEQHIQQQLHELLQQCDSLLLQCHPRMMFQHVSAVLWSWAQLDWRPGSWSDSSSSTGFGGVVEGQLRRCVVDRLKQCTVQQELAGKVPHAGAQLARAVSACAKLGIRDRKAWAKMCNMTDALANTLSPSEIACCCWGLARSGQTSEIPEALSAYKALLSRARQFVGFSHHQDMRFSSNAELALSSDCEIGFTYVGALNVIWAVCIADLAEEAPVGLLEGLVHVALGQQYLDWRQHQQQQQQQQQEGVAEQAAAADAVAAATEGPVPYSQQLLPHELTCMVWSLAAAARHSTRRTHHRRQEHTYRQQQQHQQLGRAGSNSSRVTSRRQKHQEQQQQHAVGQAPYADLLLLRYLLQLVEVQMASDVDQGLGPRQLATLAYGFTLLLQQQQQQQQLSNHSSNKQPQQQQQELLHRVQQQLLSAVIGLWFQALATDAQQELAGYRLPEVVMLLESVAAMPKLQQVQQQQQQVECQGDGPQQVAFQQLMGCRIAEQLSAASSAAPAAAVLAAACRRVLSAQPSELQPQTAAALLYVLNKLQCSSAQVLAAVPAAAAVALKLLNVLNNSSVLARLSDQQLVMSAVAAGHLAAGATSTNATTSSSSNHAATIPRATQTAACSLLIQLSLPLAAAAGGMKLRELATTVCAYATAQQQALQLFDAVSQAVQQREVLDHGSTWALARLLGAYATVGHTDEQLFAAVADAVLPKMSVMQSRALARFAWALAESGYHDREVFTAVGAQIVQRSGLVAPGYGPNCSTHARGSKVELASSSSSSSSRRRGLPAGGSPADGASLAALLNVQPRDVSAMVWAFGSVWYKEPKPYEVLAQTGVQLFDQFTVSQLANVLWGLAAVGFYHKELMSQVSAALSDASSYDGGFRVNSAGNAECYHEAVAGLQSHQHSHLQPHPQQQQQQQVPAILATATPTDVSTLAWSVGELRCMTPGVLQSCAMQFLGSTEQYSSADAADMAWTVISSGWAVQQMVSGHGSTTSSSSSSSSKGLDLSAGCSTDCNVPEHQWGMDSYSLLQQLLLVVLVDLEQLTPQQLANTVLVAAVLECRAGGLNTSSPSSAGCVAESAAIWGGDPQQRQQQQKQGWRQQLLSSVAGWGPGAFSAADGLKLLMAQLMLGRQLVEEEPAQEQQSQQQHQQEAVVLQKLLSAGARAAVRHTALVCSSTFCQEVLSVLRSIEGVTARQAVMSSAAAAKVAAQAAHAVVAAATATPTGSMQSDGVRLPSNGLQVHTTAAPDTSAAAAGSSSLWDVLGAEVTAQLLGHVVVNGAATSVGTGSRHSSEVLLHLVPNSHLLRSAEVNPSFHGQAVAVTPATAVDVEDATAPPHDHDICLQQVTGGVSVAASLLLQQQTCYRRSVVVTEAQWHQWARGGREAQVEALKRLLV